MELFVVNGGTDAVIVDKLEALEQVDLFSLLCFDGELDAATRDEIAAYCATRRAMFLVDPPASWTSAGIALQNLDSLMVRHEDAALYFPHLITTTGIRRRTTSTTAS